MALGKKCFATDSNAERVLNFDLSFSDGMPRKNYQNWTGDVGQSADENHHWPINSSTSMKRK
ncbi:hypothetical protein [Bradyrhizobium sp. BR 1433]|uniref:hypothetical protein n=1 Tax=Bradyrhizobium sp. BR 1433 TaxID=3447967 RepID=UPI003EE61B7E